jgi:hypothetical protein
MCAGSRADHLWVCCGWQPPPSRAGLLDLVVHPVVGTGAGFVGPGGMVPLVGPLAPGTVVVGVNVTAVGQGEPLGGAL